MVAVCGVVDVEIVKIVQPQKTGYCGVRVLLLVYLVVGHQGWYPGNFAE